jgi:hypothetical protein
MGKPMTGDRRGPPAFDLQRSVVALLRGEPPGGTFNPPSVEDCLRRYECGGYLHGLWGGDDSSERLPAMWSDLIGRAHRKTAIDNLGALVEFREVGEFLAREGIPFVLLKGAAYLVDLYDDPGERALTDIDLLLKPGDVHRVARHLAASGYEGSVDPWYPEYRRFEMVRRGGVRSRFEFHWHLGQSFRQRTDQQAVWDGTRDGRLEGMPCRLLGPEDAILYHVGHLADHYFGPTLKWIIDLREMLSRWQPDPADLANRAAKWRVRVALYLSLRHLEKLFPGEAPRDLMRRVEPGRIRRSVLARLLSSSPAELIEPDPGMFRRMLIRTCLVDSQWDALRLLFHVVSRPVVHLARHLRAPVALPWESSG